MHPLERMPCSLDGVRGPPALGSLPTASRSLLFYRLLPAGERTAFFVGHPPEDKLPKDATPGGV